MEGNQLATLTLHAGVIDLKFPVVGSCETTAEEGRGSYESVQTSAGFVWQQRQSDGLETNEVRCERMG